MLSILLWCIAGYRYYAHRQKMMPTNMAYSVGKDLHKREKKVTAFLSDSNLVAKLFSDSMSSSDEEYLQKMPFYIFAYSHDTLTFWNTNKLLASCNSSKTALLHHDRGIFVQRCYTPFANKQKQITILIPIVTLYPIENDYLESHFVAANYIPISTEVLSEVSPGSYVVKDLRNNPVLYLHFHKLDIPKWIPDSLLIWLLIAAILASVSWIQLMTIYLTRRSYLTGLLATIIIVVGFRALTYLYGLPFNLEALDFFSPRLYASSIFLPSLGAVLINVLCVLWIIVFIIRHTPYKTFFAEVKKERLARAIAVGLVFLMILYTYQFVSLIKSLVVDSSISFDVSRFYSINLYTILGLFTIAIITGVSCMIIYLFNVQISTLVPDKWMKYAGIALMAVLFILLCSSDRGPVAVLMAWLLLFVVLLDIKQLKIVADLFAPHMLFWAVFICAFCTGILQYFNHAKEHDSRLVFAEKHIAQERDLVTEYAFHSISENIQKDRIVKLFINKPVSFYRKAINERFDVLYLGGQLNKYQSKIYLFDKYGHSLYNKDTTSYDVLVQRTKSSEQVDSSTLYYKENATDGHYYLAYIPIKADKSDELIGHVFIDLSLKQPTNETVYPELLQPSTIHTDPSEAEYSYAVYLNDRLLTQTNDYPFPVFLYTDTLSVGNHIFYNRDGFSELWYKFSDNKTVLVVHSHSVWIEMVTLFSYMFGIEMGIAVIVLLYQLYLSYLINYRLSKKIVSLTLRRRVHFSMLGVVLLSFIIIGFVTIWFFRYQYNVSNRNKLQAAMRVVEYSTEQYMKQENAFSNEEKFDDAARSMRFKYFVTNIANSQKIDINIFNNTGVLDVTSQDDIYDRSLLSRIIRPDAYYQLITLGKSILIQDERVGNLSYLSCYVPLRNDEGAILGYINVPFFSSERDLNYQISNIVVTLINLYAFIFLISSIFTVFVTRWLTRTFNIIIQQFGRLNLQKNERIEWPYNDEIGLLVREYNAMVEKVEANAALLAQSERESAWREMARQVAHEIKNPLTPMKLNIQYLQQALKNNYPNAKELATKVSESIIEQIDNLSYIASEFSSFAKMPEARPEEVELSDLLAKATELYVNEPNIEVQLSRAENVVVFADRSQLLRVFTNLMENARQAIPADRAGVINVTVVKEDGYAVVSIEDNGVGISQEVMKKIFQPYFTTKSSGTGLGLAMTKKIIEFWKGQIWFTTTEGQGTTFYIRLPLVNDEA